MHNQNDNLLFAFRLICLLCVSTLTLQSQTVLLLRNGDRITGKIISETTNQVTFSTGWAKDIAIPLAEIKSRETIAAVIVTNAPVVATAAPKPVPVVVPPVKPVVKPKPPSAWHGDIQVGADVGISETRRQLYHGRFKVIYAPVAETGPNAISKSIDRFRNTFEYSTAYGTTDGVLSANRMDGSSKTDFDLGADRKFFVYNLFGAGYDEIRRIERRYEVGPGLGIHMLNRSNMVLNAELGMNYQNQYLWNKGPRTNAHDRTYYYTDRFYYRLAEDFTWKITKTLTFDEKFELFPQLDFQEYRFRFESNLRYWILENLSLNLTVVDIYDTQPANKVGRNDLQIRSSIGVKF